MANLRGDAQRPARVGLPRSSSPEMQPVLVRSSSGRGPTTTVLSAGRSCSTYSGSAAATPRPLRWPTVKRCTPPWLPEHVARLADDRAAAVEIARLAFDERGVVAVGHETDFLAVGLLGDRQAESPRDIAHLVLRQIADREARARQLLLGQREQEIRLILCGVEAAAKHVAARLRVDPDARVVSGRDDFGAVGHRSIEQRGELQVAVAVRARNRRAAAMYSLTKFETTVR